MNPITTSAEPLALLRANRRGVLAICAAMACFVVNDALVKYVSQALPTAQLILIRGVMASLLVLAVAHALGATTRMRRIVHRWVLARAGIDALATVLYLASLFQLPIASATAIVMASPLFLTLLAALVLRERVGWPRWAATSIGFVGVLLIIQPSGSGFNAYALLCLAATALHAVRDLVTRRIDSDVPSILVTLATAVMATALAGIVSLGGPWQPFGLDELGLLALAAVFLAAAYYAIVAGMRHGEMSVVAPFRYTGLLWALVLGYAVWSELPNPLAWCGIALLLGSVLYMLHRERRRARASRP
ncbi:MAG: DMT family transporter, partial [Burkholderiales bacterium]